MNEEETINRFLNVVAIKIGGNVAEDFKNRYIAQQKEIEQLKQANKNTYETSQELLAERAERIEYLERSNDRREDTILDLRQDIVSLQTIINKAIEYIEEHRTIVDERNGDLLYWVNDDFDEQKIIDILKGVDKE